jgi:hypothetical protein
MRHFVRGLILAVFLVLGFLRPQVSMAAPRFCMVFETGNCTLTCATCSANAPCPNYQGRPQICLCGLFCP